MMKKHSIYNRRSLCICHLHSYLIKNYLRFEYCMITYNYISIMKKHRADYLAKFNKENYKMYPFRVKKNDSKLIDKLESVSNRNGYITNLILNDIEPQILTIKQIKQSIRPVIEKHDIKNVYLFGSYARGDANKNSDVDIYCDSGDIKSLWDLSAFKEELEKVLGKDVDIVTIGSTMHDYFKKQIEEDMIKIC